MDRKKINGVTQMIEMEPEVHELDPALVRTGRLGKRFLWKIKGDQLFFVLLDFVVVLLMI